MGFFFQAEDYQTNLARVSSYSWWNDYVTAYNRSIGEKNPAYLQQFQQTVSQYTDWNQEGINLVQGQINWIIDQNADKKLLGGLVEIDRDLWEGIGEAGAIAGTAGLVAGAGYAIYTVAAPTVAAGAGGEIATATGAEVVGAYGGLDSAAVASASYATPEAVAGAASVYGGTESLVYGGFDAGADYAAATIPSNLASAPSVIDQLKTGANWIDRLYSTGSKIYNLFTGGSGSAPASAPLNGYAPELVNPINTGGLFGSIYPGEFAGGPLPGFATPGKSPTLIDFLKSGSGLAMFLAIGLLIAGVIMFSRR